MSSIYLSCGRIPSIRPLTNLNHLLLILLLVNLALIPYPWHTLQRPRPNTPHCLNPDPHRSADISVCGSGHLSQFVGLGLGGLDGSLGEG